MLDNALNGLSLIALGGLLSGFLSYCVSYGQFSQLDPHLMPAFASTDLATNFAILAVPLFNAITAVIFMAPFLYDYIIKDRPLEGDGRILKKINIVLLPIGIIVACAWVLGSDHIYLLWFRLGVLLISLIVAVMIRAKRKGVPLAKLLNWSGQPFTALHLGGVALIAIAFTLSNFGKYETISRMRDFNNSTLYMRSDGGLQKKVVVIFASPERAVLFDGMRVFIISSRGYEKFLTNPELSNFDRRPFTKRLF